MKGKAAVIAAGLLPGLALLIAGGVEQRETRYTTDRIKERFFAVPDTVKSDSLIKHGRYQRYHNNGRAEEEGFFHHGRKSSRWTYWWKNGQKKEEGYYDGGEREGAWRGWWETGRQWYEGYYKYGSKEGKWTVRYKNGRVEYDGYFRDDLPEGKWTYWDKDGYKLREVYYSGGKTVREEIFNKR